MRATRWAVLIGVLALPLACGDQFSSGPDEGGPSDTLREACERYCVKAVGCDGLEGSEAACTDVCITNLANAGACEPAAVALVDCYRTDFNGCALPGSCLSKAVAYAGCRGLGCAPGDLTCGASATYDCWCSGFCGSATWALSTPCNENPDGSKILCDCSLQGPLAPNGPGTVTASCEGANSCDDSWGCCRALLAP